VIVSLIAALDEQGGIGKDGRLPWRLRADLRRFKQVTMGHAVIMGRKTQQSIGRALPGRTNIVITRRASFHALDFLVARSLEQALGIAREHEETEAFVIGGGEIYALALPHAERLYLTRLHATVDCDTFFPEVDWSQWRQVQSSQHPADEDNQVPSTFQVWERNR
jgi:dihydrofolate reductase